MAVDGQGFVKLFLLTCPYDRLPCTYDSTSLLASRALWADSCATRGEVDAAHENEPK